MYTHSHTLTHNETHTHTHAHTHAHLCQKRTCNHEEREVECRIEGGVPSILRVGCPLPTTSARCYTHNVPTHTTNAVCVCVGVRLIQLIHEPERERSQQVGTGNANILGIEGGVRINGPLTRSSQDERFQT